MLKSRWKGTYCLIEAAEQLAKKALKFPCKKVEVEIKKLWAPILLPLDTVSVSITRMGNGIFVDWPNMGDEGYLEAAIEELKSRTIVR
ncbi:MAG: dihydroneopterin aldolase [Clostridium sp.]